MMQLPGFLKPFKKAAEEYLKQGLVLDLEFSGETYQVEVTYPGTQKNCWAFLQLDKHGQIKDCFCSCEEAEEFTPCVHIAAAFLRIYNGEATPLHQRFEHSFWNKLCMLSAEKMGYDSETLKFRGKGHYTFLPSDKGRTFSVKGKTAKGIAHLKEIIELRKKETEETSLKFSNLSQEELSLWKQGNPSAQLQYELSFWYDIAKWLMILQDLNSKYTLLFEYSEQNVPNKIIVTFPEVELFFEISEHDLSLLIPTLVTINSPLKVHDALQEGIEKVIYDKKTANLIIEQKNFSIKNSNQIDKHRTSPDGIEIGEWIFIRNDGFYAKSKHTLLLAPVLSGNEISKALTEYLPIFKKVIQNTVIHDEAIQASYSIFFDHEWNFHIRCYAFRPGDISSGHSHYFGDWIYLDEKGFYRLENQRFDQLEMVILNKDVPDFVRQYRVWLNTQEGFNTHLASIEAHLTYNLTSDNRLSFSRIAVKDEEGESKDFGSWVYIKGEGFYSKISSQVRLSLRPGIELNANQIPLFIKMNREELHLVPGFFSEKCPLLKAGLSIELTEEECVVITPEYLLLPEYEKKEILFFDDYVYVESEGFHELPLDNRLPERFRHRTQIENSAIDPFLNYELEKIKQFAFKIDPRLVRPTKINLMASSIVEVKDRKGWYELNLFLHTEKGKIPLTAIWWALRKKKHFFFDEAGMLDLQDRRFNWLKLLGKNRLDRISNTITLSTLEFIRLNALDNIQVESDSDLENPTKAILKELTDLKNPEEPDLSGLNSALRPYQKIGVSWLWFLYHHKLSGLLCDDMGLGKTHQAMALLAAICNFYKKKGERIRKHFLIVCPTSVIFHWQEKIQNYLPGIRVCTFYGTNRSLEDFHNQYDVLLTSYGIWRIENELLSKVPFELAIFDEIQVAKNHSSLIYNSLLTVNAEMRIGLTGTPIENHLRELKALFDIVLPSYMPADSDYREFFIKPIERLGNNERRILLSRFIKPFMMRRKKGDVLLDLPEKIEEVAHCSLSFDQQQLYIQVLKSSRQKILRELQDEQNPIPYIHIFALLSNLKQICDHPAVFLKDPQNYKQYQSDKWDLFVELLNEARDSQQKVVVFSQYLHMLDIFENYLNDSGIGFATIRGSTSNRGEQVHRFNNDPHCEVFLGSLQASGLGIDLTSASVVIHYDRWWNAARENQATDRVHRIGQTRGVQVFKLVTKNTFEERIDSLITKKGQLMENVVGTDDHQFIKQFNREELAQMLQYVELGDE
jgi:SNF2 family DNA or RNA helicase